MTNKSKNIVIIMSDEQSWDTLGCHGNPVSVNQIWMRLPQQELRWIAALRPIRYAAPLEQVYGPV